MPRPIPDYVPPEIKDLLAARGVDMQTLSKQMGYSRGKLYTYFSSNHSQVLPYRVIADAFRISLDELRLALIDGSFPQQLEEMAISMGCGSVTDLARKLRLSPSLIVKLRSGERKGESLEPIYQVAKALNLSMAELLEIQEKYGYN